MFSVICFFAVLLILSPTTGATGFECKIYVSSSDGINSTSCWTGGYQTPCATLDLALQGTATAAGNCSSFSIIYLYPGDYTLDTTTGLEKHNNVSITGNGSKDVIVCVLSTEPPLLSENDCPFYLNVTVANPSLSLTCPQECALIFTAYITNHCNPTEKIEWTSYLDVYLDSSFLTKLSYQTCYNMCSEKNCIYGSYYLDLSQYSYSGAIFKNGTNSIELDIGDLSIASTILNVTVACQEPYVVSDGYCSYAMPNCDNQDYCPLVPASSNEVCFYNNETQCAYCPPGNGVSINKINKCVQCDNLLINLLIFIGIEILPITIIVLLIIILNIQLTNGSMNGLVFYSQIIFFIYSDFVLVIPNNHLLNLLASPCNIFNLDFTPFLGNYSLCIVPNMSPLGAISFWYVIVFYPLLLLLLIYVWIILYDKGFKCVVLVTRPFHRCMARFWSMTGIEPSLIHSTASIYILCFTQIAGVSFKILRFSFKFNTDSMSFFYDSNVKYFQDHQHVVAGSVAILVLIAVIIIPALYIQFYRFKWLHKLLGILHLRKQLLISLGDVFTGPYKNGSNNTFDYRFFAGFYLLARVIIMSSLILPFGIAYVSLSFYITVLPIQGSCVFLLAIMVLIFRPFKRDIHNFFEVIMLIMEISFFVSLIIVNVTNDNKKYNYMYYCPTSLYDRSDDMMTAVIIVGSIVVSFNCLLFSILAFYINFQLVKMMSNNCYYYWKQHNCTVPANRDQEEIQLLNNNTDDWVADRMENPQDYDEQHVTVSLVDSLLIDTEQPNTTAATYGSTDN